MEDDYAKGEEEALEEVYLCNCCGVTRPLRHSWHFMPTLRALFLASNFFVFAFGLGCLGMGLWFRIDPKVYELHKYIETQNFTIGGWILLFGGFVACLASLGGFGAALRLAAGKLTLYALTMCALVVALVGAIVLLTVHGLGAELERFIVKEIFEQIRRRSMGDEGPPTASQQLAAAIASQATAGSASSSSASASASSSAALAPTLADLPAIGEAAQFLDFVQVKLRCCGAVDFRDYIKLGKVVSTTCYTIDKNYVGAPGCGRAIRDLFDLRAGLALGFATGAAVAQILAGALAMTMFCSVYHWRATPRREPAQARAGRQPANRAPHLAAVAAGADFRRSPSPRPARAARLEAHPSRGGGGGAPPKGQQPARRVDSPMAGGAELAGLAEFKPSWEREAAAHLPPGSRVPISII